MRRRWLSKTLWVCNLQLLLELESSIDVNKAGERWVARACQFVAPRRQHAAVRCDREDFDS